MWLRIDADISWLVKAVNKRAPLCIIVSIYSYTPNHSARSEYRSSLTYLVRNKMADIFRWYFQMHLREWEFLDFLTKFDLSPFLRVQLTLTQHWFRFWLGDKQATRTRHYLNQWWLRLVTHICVTRPQWVNNCTLTFAAMKTTNM